MNQTLLFIGGTRDGQRIAVPTDRLNVELPVGPKPKGKGAVQPSEIYGRMRFSGETDQFDVFALKGVTGNSVLRALIERYRKEEAS